MEGVISSADKHLLPGADVDAAVQGGLGDWRPLFGVLAARFDTGDFATGARLVAEVAGLADAMDHHPDLDLRYGFVEVRTWSHDVGGITRRDLRLAKAVSQVAAELEVSATPARLQAVDSPADALPPPFLGKSEILKVGIMKSWKHFFSGNSGKSSKIDFCHIWPLEASRGVQNAATGCGIILPARDRHSENKKRRFFLGRANSARGITFGAI